MRVAPIACYFTHGDRRAQDGRQVTIGKAWLVSRLQALLQTGRIHLPKTAEAATLARELQDYEIKVDQDANHRYGAFKVGTHYERLPDDAAGPPCDGTRLGRRLNWAAGSTPRRGGGRTRPNQPCVATGPV